MADRVARAIYEVECPHCGKSFAGELLKAPSASSPSGFKCPHCRLFVPLERTDGERTA